MNKKIIFKLFLCATLMVSFFGITSVYADSDAESTNHDNVNDKHRTCLYFINDYNGRTLSSSCAPEGTSGTKSYTHRQTEFTSGGTVYKLDGWYDEAGNKVSDNAKVSVSYTASSEKCVSLYFYLRWNEERAPILIFNYIDNVSTGSGSWTNSDGVTSDFSHKFKEPESQNHYKFLYWKIDDQEYYDGDTYTYSFRDKEPNTTETVNAYAWWQSSVTLNLYDGNNLLDSKEDFEKVSIDYTPEKAGYNFVGWTDEDGNLVTEEDFYPYEKSSDKIDPKVVNLYAKWERITMDVTINKTWNDNSNSKNLRPDTIYVNLYADNQFVEKYSITKDMNWLYKLSLYKYTEDGNLINYYIDEDSVTNYVSLITDFDILNTLSYNEIIDNDVSKKETNKTNAHKKTKNSKNGIENPNTGDNIIYYLLISIVSITGIAFSVFYIKKVNI